MACGGSLGGVTMCSMGPAPLPLAMLPMYCVLGPTGPFTNMNSTLPIVNVPSRGVCLVPPIPKPCVPAMAPAWVPPIPFVLIGNAPVHDNTAIAICTLGGVVNIVVPTQFMVMFG
jgi:hypothetical protein